MKTLPHVVTSGVKDGAIATCILCHVVHPVGGRSSQTRDGEIIDAHLLCFPLRTPFKRSSSCRKLGSLLTVVLRPPPLRRIRPTPGSLLSCSSWIPWLIASSLDRCFFLHASPSITPSLPASPLIFILTNIFRLS